MHKGLLSILHEINAEDWDHQRLARRKAFLMTCTRKELDVIREDLHQRIERAWDKFIYNR